MGYLFYSVQLPVYIPVLISCVIMGVTLGGFALVVIRRQQSQFRSNQHFYDWHLSLLTEERKRIMTDLHDTTNSTLYLALVMLESIKKENPGQPLEQVSALIREAIAGMGHVVQNMNDEKIIRQGLQNSLRLMIGRYQNTNTLPVIDFDYKMLAPVPPLVTYTIFQMVQELFSNTLRHSGARNIQLRIRQHQQLLYLYYADDGHGMNPKTSGTGLGLRSMRNRAARLGGTFKTEAGKGLRYFITIPLTP
ncbi:sensor histidine kinase [Niabella hirudinis]|uniref:sensor histidine kinase n=1 Tax=Niabella hirudinis TaxID=1285929 RepID=UPI003EBB31A2